MENILEVNHLTKNYGKFRLDDVSFSVPNGCIAGFIGVNGAGKSTAIHTMLGLTPSDGGHIKLFGVPFTGAEADLKNRIGVVLDSNYFYEELTISEMKQIIAPAYTSWSDSDFSYYLDAFRLTPGKLIASLSKGMKVKFALALALSHKAELLIMDEPTSGLDPLIRKELLKILRDYMKKDGKGVFFSTHITSDLDKIADMLIMLDNGKIIFQEEKDSLLDNYRLIKGDIRLLDKDIRQLFLSLEMTDYGFIGLTNKAGFFKPLLPDIVIERPSVEDIMLACVHTGPLGR